MDARSLTPTRRDALELLQNGILAFARAEQAGMRVDLEYCTNTQERLAKKINILERNFKESNFYRHWHHHFGAKTNIDSGWQLSEILYKVRKIEPAKLTDSGRGATDEEAIARLGIPELEPLVEIRGLRKLKDTYLESLIREQVAGFIHPFFNLHTVRTYRSSSDRPNFHNFPKRDEQAMSVVRRALFPRKGHMLGEVDYKGIEVCVSTCYHKDPNMKDYVLNPANDMHRDVAIEVFFVNPFDKKNPQHYTLRQAAKNGFVFPQFYGDYYVHCAQNMACGWCKLPKGKWRSGDGIEFGDGTIADHLIANGIKSYDAFEEHVKQVERTFWGKRFKVYAKWRERWWSDYQDAGYFDLYTGFRCSGLMRRNDVTNYPIQGSAFHCLLWSFIELDRIQREEKWDSRLIGQIHDAIVLDINPKELDHVMQTVRRVTCVELLKHWDWIIVPLEVEADVCEVDEPWNKKQPYKIAA